MKRIIIVFILLFTSVSWTIAQKLRTTGEAIVGKPCPDLFFQKTINYSKSALYLHELRGKWVILDLWSMNCGACVSNFPHISKEQAKFKDKVQFFMGTYDDPEGKNAAIYSHFTKMLHLNMPCGFKGTSETKPTDLFKQFKVGALPFVVIIDPAGIVRAVTVTVNEQQIQSLLNGEMPKFADAPYSDDRNKTGKAQYDTSIPYLVNGNGGNDSRDQFEYRTVISTWKPEINSQAFVEAFIPGWPANNKKFPLGRLEGIGLDLNSLYRMAYFGRFNSQIFNNVVKNVGKTSNNFSYQTDTSNFVWQYPILEMKDTSEFISNGNQNLYCYSLIVPPADGTQENMMEIMQSDLKHYFKYDSRMETRPMPCWKLVVSDSTLVKELKTKGGKYEATQPIPRVSRKAVNFTMEGLALDLKYNAGLYDKPFINETGINYNVDIYYEYVPDHIESINDAIRKFGLKIVKNEIPMKVLVIRDPKPAQSTVN